jgi:hypothetical protein
VAKSSGQFTYASTVINYVISICHRPMDRLEEVLGIRSGHNLPFAELDALYIQILSSVENIETVYNILALMMIPGTAYQDKKELHGNVPFPPNPGDVQLLFAVIRG